MKKIATDKEKYILKNLSGFGNESLDCNNFPDRSINQALCILGCDNVITADETAREWGIEVPEIVPVPYSKETLLDCAEQNKSGKGGWHLTYSSGLSLIEKEATLTDEYPYDYDRPDFFRRDERSWWETIKSGKLYSKGELSFRRELWGSELVGRFEDILEKVTERHPYKGYLLINLKPLLKNPFEKQQKEIKRLKGGLKQTDDLILFEFFLTDWLLRKSKRRRQYSQREIYCTDEIVYGGVSSLKYHNYSFWCDKERDRIFRLVIVFQYKYPILVPDWDIKRDVPISLCRSPEF